MRKIFIVAILVFGVFVGFAQKDVSTLDILKSVEKKGLGYKTIKSAIKYKLENNQDNSVEEVKGEIIIKGNKFQLAIDETITYSDGKTKWVYLNASNEVNITDVVPIEEMEPEEKFMNEPLSIYSLYKVDFKYKTSGDQTLDGEKYKIIDLTPESLDKPYFKIRYWITESYDIYAVKYFQKDGMRITLYFSDLKVNAKISDADFVFEEKDYPDVEVIDMR